MKVFIIRNFAVELLHAFITKLIQYQNVDNSEFR